VTLSTRPRPHQAAWRDFALTLPVAVVVVGLIGLVRLERQFPAAGSSPALLVPFLLPVLALALEAGALVALSAVQLGVLAGLNAPAAAARARVSWPLLGLLGLVLGVAELIPRGTEHPGTFANELVQTARSSCGATGTVPIPLLGLSVRCGTTGRIEGPMPGVRSVQVAMHELTFSDDLRRVDIVGLDLTAKQSLHVHLAAAHARIAGLAPWSRSPRLTSAARFAILSGLGVALWLAATLGWRARKVAVTDPESAGDPKPRGRVALWLLGRALVAVPGAIAAAGFISLDQDRAEPLVYASAALFGVVALVGLSLLGRRVPRIFSSFSAF
jgi:hypothetical protein